MGDIDWEARYSQGDTPWNKGVAAPPLVDFLSRHPIRGTVLVPGAGHGHDVRLLAARGATVTGLDLSETAVRLARSYPPIGSEIPETYVQGDLFLLPAAWHHHFDWVIEHTCFCAIPPARRPEYVRAIAQALKPGGHFLAIFYLAPEAPQGPPFGVTREEIAALFDLHFTLLEEWVPVNAFPWREGRELCQLWRKTL
jgi:SAM-dependent methyltransferase